MHKQTELFGMPVIVCDSMPEDTFGIASVVDNEIHDAVFAYGIHPDDFGAYDRVEQPRRKDIKETAMPDDQKFNIAEYWDGHEGGKEIAARMQQLPPSRVELQPNGVIVVHYEGGQRLKISGFHAVGWRETEDLHLEIYTRDLDE